MAGASQEALYASIDLELSWSEEQLPQTLRTKHVHGLHPYLGKFVPQLVEVFLRRSFQPGDCVSTRSQAAGRRWSRRTSSELTRSAATSPPSTACWRGEDEALLAGRAGARSEGRAGRGPPLAPLDARRERVAPPLVRARGPRRAPRVPGAPPVRLEPPYDDVARVVLSRAARSARLTTHFDLDLPREPVTGPYQCRKHKRECRPVTAAREVPCPLHDRHCPPAARVRGSAQRARRERPARRRADRVRRGDRESSPRRRTRGSSTTTNSTGTRTSCSGYPTGGRSRSARPLWAGAARRSDATSRP